MTTVQEDAEVPQAAGAPEAAGADGAWADLIGLAAIGLMWALSLAALAGLAWLLGRWMRNREERRKRPAALGDGAAQETSRQRTSARTSWRTRRSIRRGRRRQDNASDLDGWV
ncbi:hypothetical protein [Nesterenkonia suensis]